MGSAVTSDRTETDSTSTRWFSGPDANGLRSDDGGGLNTDRPRSRDGNVNGHDETIFGHTTRTTNIWSPVRRRRVARARDNGRGP